MSYHKIACYQLHACSIDSCNTHSLTGEACFWTPGVEATWSEARDICAGSGSHHVYISSTSENEMIRSMANGMLGNLLSSSSAAPSFEFILVYFAKCLYL